MLEDDMPLRIFNKKYYNFNVEDLRKTDPNAIDGLDDKRIIFQRPLKQYIAEYFNKSIMPPDTGSLKKISVFIDQLRSDKYKTLKYSFRFKLPVSEDSSEMIRIADVAVYTGKGVDGNQQLLNLALTASLESLFSKEGSGIIVKNNSENLPVKANLTNTALLPALNSPVKIYSLTEEVTADTTKRIKKSSVGFLYYKGSNIKEGFQLNYSFGSRKKSENLMLSYGLSLMIVQTENNDYKGNMFAFGVPFNLDYFFSDDDYTFFVGAQARLLGGKETIDYGYETTENTYLGPVLEPYVGYKIYAVSVDAGVYLMKLFGSKMLPDDTGIRCNLKIWF